MKYQPKSSNQLTSLLVATILCFLGANAFAEGGKAKRMFERADANGDGMISFDEFQGKKPREPRADLDGDGQVTREEMNEHASAKGDAILEKANEHFSRMDINGDDVITAEEAKEAAFNRLDKDQDGYLTPKELKRAKKRRHDRRQG